LLMYALLPLESLSVAYIPVNPVITGHTLFEKERKIWRMDNC